MAFHLLVVLPSPSPNKVSTLKSRFHSSILSLWVPLSTLNSTPYNAKLMTWGLGGVLTLPSIGITSGAATAPIFYRFILAHCVAYLSFLSIWVFYQWKTPRIDKVNALLPNLSCAHSSVQDNHPRHINMNDAHNAIRNDKTVNQLNWFTSYLPALLVVSLFCCGT